MPGRHKRVMTRRQNRRTEALNMTTMLTVTEDRNHSIMGELSAHAMPWLRRQNLSLRPCDSLRYFQPVSLWNCMRTLHSDNRDNTKQSIHNHQICRDPPNSEYTRTHGCGYLYNNMEQHVHHHHHQHQH